MKRNEVLIMISAIIVIILTFGWCIKILLGTPIAKEIKTGTEAIRSGSQTSGESLINN